MTVGVVQVSQRIERHTERVDLSPRVLLKMRPVLPKAIGVARMQFGNSTVGIGDFALIRKAVTAVDPAINPPRERTRVAVNVFVSKLRVERCLRIRP